MKSALIVVVAASCVAIVACGGAAPEPKAPPAESPATAAPAAGSSTEPTVTGTGAGGSSPESRGVARARAKSELEDARRELASAGTDCGSACKALASMERAAQRLCELVEPEGDGHDACDDARAKVRTATDRVRSSCGTCR